MTEQGHADLFKVLVGQAVKNRKFDVILGKALSVLPNAESLEPIPNATLPPRNAESRDATSRQ